MQTGAAQGARLARHRGGLRHPPDDRNARRPDCARCRAILPRIGKPAAPVPDGGGTRRALAGKAHGVVPLKFPVPVSEASLLIRQPAAIIGGRDTGDARAGPWAMPGTVMAGPQAREISLPSAWCAAKARGGQGSAQQIALPAAAGARLARPRRFPAAAVILARVQKNADRGAGSAVRSVLYATGQGQGFLRGRRA